MSKAPDKAGSATSPTTTRCWSASRSGYHEPYYESYIGEDFPAIARGFGLTHRGDAKAFVSKVMVFDKEAG